tara:strand:+ start:1195 stop:1560 length:366 start_codon:yes stop_codon:yes gene_type:complete
MSIEVKAKELRIGNIVSIVGQPSGKRFNYSIPSGQSIDMIFVKRNNHDAKPIPLTEEWLVKFGFEWKNHALRLGLFAIRKEINGFVIHLSNESHYKKIDLKHVHQLQNLLSEVDNLELAIK